MGKSRSSKNKGQNSLRKSDKSSTQSSYIAVDVGFQGFKDDFSKLEVDEISDFFDAISRLQKMTWQQLWDTSTKKAGEKRGFNYEKIEGQTTPGGNPVHSIRITKKFRARVSRQDRWMRFISLHPDHDSTYKK